MSDAALNDDELRDHYLDAFGDCDDWPGCLSVLKLVREAGTLGGAAKVLDARGWSGVIESARMIRSWGDPVASVAMDAERLGEIRDTIEDGYELSTAEAVDLLEYVDQLLAERERS